MIYQIFNLFIIKVNNVGGFRLFIRTGGLEMNDQNLSNTDKINPDQTAESTLLYRLNIAPGLGYVQATVNNGVATLTGRVKEEVDIKRAVLMAQAVEGIREVHEEIQVAADELEGISPAIPSTGEATSDITPIEEAVNPTTVVDENNLATVIKEGMDVFDSEGKKVGKVKTVRQSDFLLARLLAKNYFVPYFVCNVNAEGVYLNIKGSEINDQGWAFPHMETP